MRGVVGVHRLLLFACPVVFSCGELSFFLAWSGRIPPFAAFFSFCLVVSLVCALLFRAVGIHRFQCFCLFYLVLHAWSCRNPPFVTVSWVCSPGCLSLCLSVSSCFCFRPFVCLCSSCFCFMCALGLVCGWCVVAVCTPFL